MLHATVKLLKNLVMRRSAYRFFMRDWRALGDLGRCADAAATFRHSVNLEPILMEGPQGKRILVIAPHPDDEILGAGGTLIASIGRGAKVRVFYLTRGKASQAEALMKEAAAVARLVGYETRFLNYYARCLPLDAQIIDTLREEIEIFGPQVLMLPFLCDDHDDHRRASHLLWLTHQAHSLPPGLEIWAYQVYTALIPNVVVDITATAEHKRTAIAGWASQAGSRDWAHYALGLNAFNSRFLPGATGPRFAEAFFVLPLEDYCELCGHYFGGNPGSAYYTEGYVQS